MIKYAWVMLDGRTAMATTHGPETVVDRILETAAFGQQNIARLTRGYERLMEGLMNVAIQQIEVTQNLIAGDFADLDLLTRAGSAGGLIEAEFEILRRRSERIASATQQITEELNRSWVETCACVQPAADAVR